MTTPLRIGIDCRTILNPGLGEAAGVGHYTYCLVKNLLEVDKENHYVLFFDNRMPDTSEFEQANTKIWRFPFFQYKKFLPFGYSHMLIAAMILKNRLDVHHSPASVLPLTYPKASVLTIHDLAIFRNPSWFSSQRVSRKFLVPRSIKKAKHIIAVSESTKKDLRELFHVPASKISVIHEAALVAPINVKDRNVDAVKKFHLRTPYLLFLGTIEPRKNLERLAEAFGKVAQRNSQHPVQLILAGGTGFRGEEILALIKKKLPASLYRHIGYVTHNEKLSLLRNATGFLFPSVYEGFGLPVLEAMSVGTPVITSNTSSLPEIAGHAALSVHPEKTADITRAIDRLLSDTALRHTLVSSGKERAKMFSWERAALETLAVYTKVARRKTAQR